MAYGYVVYYYDYRCYYYYHYYYYSMFVLYCTKHLVFSVTATRLLNKIKSVCYHRRIELNLLKSH